MTSPPYLQTWNGDETLYSWAAAHHELRGSSAEETGLLLFGQSRAWNQHEIPPGLDHFARWSRGSLGSLEELAVTRTQLEEWRPFRQRTQLRRVIDRIGGDKTMDVRYSMGICASRLGFRRPLRFCADCCRAQMARSGVTGWRIPHQRMAVLVCAEHHRILQCAPTISKGWTLPPLGSADLNNFCLNAVEVDIGDLLRLAVVAEAFGDLPGGASVSDHANALRTAMAGSGLARALSYMDGDRLANWLQESRTGRIARAAFPAAARMFSPTCLVPLLRGRRSGHPFIWHVLWAAATEHLGPDDTAQLVRQHLPKDKYGEQASLLEDDAEGYSLVVAKVLAQTPSLLEAALQLGVPPRTLKQRVQQSALLQLAASGLIRQQSSHEPSRVLQTETVVLDAQTTFQF